MEKDLLAIVFADKTVALAQVEPFDPAVEPSAIVYLAGARSALLRDHDFQALVGHLSLGLDGKDELLATFLTGDECVSKVHCASDSSA